MRFKIFTTAALAALIFVGTSSAENFVFPEDAVVNIAEEYDLVGDGKTDNTAAFQKMFDERRGKLETKYLPDGVYVVSDSIGIFGGKPHSRDRFINLQGQSREGTVIRLVPNADGFDNPEEPKVVLSLYEGKSTGDVMQTYASDFTLEVGAGNPGAAGLRYMTNNVGTVTRVTIRSLDPDGAGYVGLDLRQSQNGPGLARDIRVEGFDYGIRFGNTFSFVAENIDLINPRKMGVHSRVGRITMRNLNVEGAPIGYHNGKHGDITLISANFTGGPGGEDSAAVHFEDRSTFLRDVTVSGYAAVAKNLKNGELHDLNEYGEFTPLPPQTLFESATPASLRLPIEEIPKIPWETDLSKWYGVGNGSQKGKLGTDITDELQATIDEAAAEGGTTIYFRRGKYKITRPIRVHGSINRIIGFRSNLNFTDDGDLHIDKGSAAFVLDGLDGGKDATIVFERIFLMGGWERPKVCVFDNKDQATVVFSTSSWTTSLLKRNRGGRWFINDVAGSRRGPTTIGKGEKLWARQYNPESPESPMLIVEDGGQAWVLGIKTEGRATHLIANNGAKVEILGGVSYQSWDGQKLNPPVLDVTDSDVSATFGFYHHGDRGFTTIVEETHDGTTRELPRKGLPGYHLGVYRSAPAE